MRPGKRENPFLVIDKRPNIAGNVYTEEIEKIHVHKYGAIYSIQITKSMELYYTVRRV